MSVLPQLLKIHGLPAHPLLVHLTVVLVPVVAMGAVAYLVPSWRDWLRWPLLVGAVVSGVSLWASYLTGQQLQDGFFRGDRQVEQHQAYAGVFRVVGTVFVLALVGLTGWLHRRAGLVRTAASGVTAALAVATLVYVFLTGEAGAKATYPPEIYQDAGAPAASSR